MLALLELLLLTVAPSQAYFTEQEVCAEKTFKASCALAGEVLMIREAQYGRLKLSRCIKTDHGYLGCKQDKSGVLDSLCSGKPSCSVLVGDSMMQGPPPLCAELKSYLHISYSCIRVHEGSICLLGGSVKVTARPQTISSALSRLAGCGDERLPWRLEAPDGQRIELTLHDFDWRKNNEELQKLQRMQLTVCQQYASVRETSTGRTTSLCSQAQRVGRVYRSETNALEISLDTHVASSADFLVEFVASGCATPPETPGTRVERNEDTLSVTCLQSGKSWTLLCRQDRWTGEQLNCSYLGPRVGPRISIGRMSMPYGVAIAVVCGVAIVIGMLILTVGLVVFKSRSPAPRLVVQPEHCGRLRLPPAPNIPLPEEPKLRECSAYTMRRKESPTDDGSNTYTAIGWDPATRLHQVSV